MIKYVYFSESLQFKTCSLYKCYMKCTTLNMYTSLLETIPNKGQQVKVLLGRTHYRIKI
jgi:hypothetical protein